MCVYVYIFFVSSLSFDWTQRSHYDRASDGVARARDLGTKWSRNLSLFFLDKNACVTRLYNTCSALIQVFFFLFRAVSMTEVRVPRGRTPCTLDFSRVRRRRIEKNQLGIYSARNIGIPKCASKLDSGYRNVSHSFSISRYVRKGTTLMIPLIYILYSTASLKNLINFSQINEEKNYLKFKSIL